MRVGLEHGKSESRRSSLGVFSSVLPGLAVFGGVNVTRTTVLAGISGIRLQCARKSLRTGSHSGGGTWVPSRTASIAGVVACAAEVIQ